MTDGSRAIFNEVRNYPDPSAQRQYQSLIGLDEAKSRLLKEAHILLDPVALQRWGQMHYGQKINFLSVFKDRPPLFIFAGDVGTGKTALAETFGDAIARTLGIDVTLYAMSLTSRGTGAVGQMTALISAAFTEIETVAKAAKRNGDRPNSAYVLLIDEADALAQSREAAQMHHEDRAGVNALIRGIDVLGSNGLPAVVVMCTNRLGSIDPAVRRRAAAIFTFKRPNNDQRRAVFTRTLTEVGFKQYDVDLLVEATGPTDDLEYGHTFSDLTQKLLPAMILDAFPERPLTVERALVLANAMTPTPPFRSEK